jgi:hypothetical protein
MSPAGERAAAGSVADEAARLLEAVQQWAAAHEHEQPGPGQPGSAEAAAGPHLGPECRYCPVCQLIAIVRGTRPDVAAHLAEAAAGLLEAVRSAVVAHERTWAARPGRPVERIDIG